MKLSHIYYSQSGHNLLTDISFSLDKGRIVGLLGVNGAGKSTTLKIVAGILCPDSGEVTRSSDETIGYVPELPPLIPTWSVRRFLAHACVLQGLGKAQHKVAIARVTEQCELYAILDKSCSELSKGNQQRVAIAQALLHKPDVLILDEPTSGLDPQQIRQFRELLNTLKSNTAIVLSSHIMQEITALCDTSIVIHEGKQIGELDLSNRDQRVLVEFDEDVSFAEFDGFSQWQSGEGNRHQFVFDTPSEKNSVLVYCLEKKLPISRVVGIEDLAEREFLTLIGRCPIEFA